MYDVNFNYQYIQTYSSIEEACCVVIGMVRKAIENNRASWQLLEGGCWIAEPGRCHLTYYDAHEISIDKGWMEE